MATDKLVDFDHVTDYISRDAALSCFHDWIDRYGHEHSADEMTEYQRIEELPAADVRPVVKAQRRRETEVMAAVVSGHYGGRTPYGEREEETMRDERLLLNAMQEEMGHAKEKSEE